MILNLTQHPATEDQLAHNVVEPKNKDMVIHYLTYNTIPTFNQMASNARALARICIDEGYVMAMIGGAPFFMPVLEEVLKELNYLLKDYYQSTMKLN